MKFFNYLKSKHIPDSNHAKIFKAQFEKLFDGQTVEIYDNLKVIVADWQESYPEDENLVYADLMINFSSYTREEIISRVNSLKPLEAVDRNLHSWFLSCTFVILLVYLNDDLRQIYPMKNDPDQANIFSQELSKKANEEEYCSTLLEKSYDNEELGINTRILHVTIFSKYVKYINLTCDDFACEFEKIIFTSANQNSESVDVIKEFRNLVDVWKRRCPDDANMACGYVTAYITDLSEDELNTYVDLAENGRPIDQDRHFVMSKAMSGALKVRNNTVDEEYKTPALDCADYAKKFRQLYEKIFDGNGDDSDDKKMADLLFSWGLNCPDDANAVLARTLMFNSALTPEAIDENIEKLKTLRPVDEEVYPWLLRKTLFEILDEDDANELLDELLNR